MSPDCECESLTPQGVLQKLRSYEVIDVREPDEYYGELGHLPGAKLVPLSELHARIDDLRSDKPLLLVCHSGRRSQVACQHLAALGLTRAFDLGGGMVRWHQMALPVERRARGA